MRTKYRILFVAILALVWRPLPAERVLAQDNEKPVDAPIQTDKKTYKVEITQRSVKFTINYSYVNRTSGVVILPSCKKPYRPSLEKKVGDRWTPAIDLMEPMCAGQPIRIGPGKTYRDTFKVEAFLPGNNIRPELKVDVQEIEGVYRLVHVLSGQNRPLPLEARVSNEFTLSK
jgi:hypothetical protein